MDRFNAITQAPSADMYSILMQLPDEAAASGSYSLPIGTQADGTMLSADLEQITHLLVCGCSGSGKTSFVQAAVLYLARNHSPKHIQFIVFDSKMVDYALFQDLPQLIMPIITENKKADDVMAWLQTESSRRLALFQQNKVKNLTSYNQLKNESLPRILVILDDFATLQINKKYSIPQSLINIIQNGRIVGIHIILVTSASSSKTLPKDLLSMIPCIVSFRVSERADSRLVINKEGAETLHVPGELMVRFQNTLQKCEGAYLPETQMSGVLKRIKRDIFLQVSTLGDLAENLFSDLLKTEAKKEPTELSESQFLNQATDVCVEFGQLSATVLQRRLRIGYAKATRIIDLLEENGIVGPSEGVKPRKVLISQAQWESAEHDLTNLKKEIASKASSFSDKKSSKSSGSSPEINLRDFNELTLDGLKLSIRDNCIRISKKVMTKLGPGTTTMAIEGRSVAGLVFRKPSLFSKGYMQIKLKPNIALSNNTPDIFPVTKDDLSYLLTIEFPSNASESVKAFMTQISEATSLPLEKADAIIKNILGSLKKQ